MPLGCILAGHRLASIHPLPIPSIPVTERCPQLPTSKLASFYVAKQNHIKLHEKAYRGIKEQRKRKSKTKKGKQNCYRETGLHWTEVVWSVGLDSNSDINWRKVRNFCSFEWPTRSLSLSISKLPGYKPSPIGSSADSGTLLAVSGALNPTPHQLCHRCSKHSACLTGDAQVGERIS